MTRAIPEGIKLEACHMFNIGMKPPAIADELEISTSTVYHILKENGIAVGGRNKTPNAVDIIGDRIDDFIKDYYRGMKLNDLLNKYDLRSYNHIYGILRVMNLTARNVTKENIQNREDMINLALDLYQNRDDLAIREICDETGIQQVMLHQEIGRRGIELRRDRYRREQFEELERLRESRKEPVKTVRPSR